MNRVSVFLNKPRTIIAILVLLALLVIALVTFSERAEAPEGNNLNSENQIQY